MPSVEVPDEEERHYELQPGQALVYDYRSPEFVNGQDRTRKLPDTLRVAQWNIERGTRLDAIIDTLRACEADLICLQELDVDCRRSGYVNVPLELARALHMQCVFACEFIELDDAARAPHNAVGPLSDLAADASGVVALPERLARRRASGHPLVHLHGNAILSRAANIAREVLVMRHSEGMDWEQEGPLLGEPRRGFRSALRVTVDPQDRTYASMPPLYVYCCHLEVFAGALTRVRQLADCIADARGLLRGALGEGAGAVPPTNAPRTAAKGEEGKVMVGGRAAVRRRAPSFIIAGDLNTMAHGIVRLSARYARDRMRFLSLGETEAMWLQRKVLARHMASIVRGCCPFSYRFPAYVTARLYELVGDSYPVWRLLYGFSSEDIDRMDNRETCFYDPGDKYGSVTLDNPDYKGLVRGKLDWMLLSNLTPRPFRESRGFARPVHVRALLASGSLAPGGTSAAYLKSIYGVEADATTGNARDEARELDERAAASHTPADGYVLLNENYAASDHVGLLMTVQQLGTSSLPQDTYPPYGAPYTTNLYALGVFLVSRAIPLALVASAVLKLRERARA